MIRYTLVCNKRHEFESWFANSAAHDKQAKRGLVTCPVCGSAKVEKALMAPRLARRGSTRRHAGTDAGCHDLAAGAGVPPEASGTARPSCQECRERWAAVSRGGPQDALRRGRAPLDLRRRLA